MKATNSNAPVQCSRTTVINAPATKVWQLLTNIDQWANWQTDISRPKMNGPLAPLTTFTWKTGGATITSTIHTVQPYSLFGWTGKTFGMYAIHNWLLTENEGKTTVTVNESMEGLLATLFKKSFNKNLQKGMDKWLELLNAECLQKL